MDPEISLRLDLELQETQQVQQAMCMAIDELGAARRQLLDQTERQIVELSLALAERLANRELSIDPSAVRHLVQEGLEALTSEDKYEIQLGADFESVLPQVAQHVKEMGYTCVVQINEGLAPGGVVVRSEFGSVDESLKSRMGILAQGVLRDVGT